MASTPSLLSPQMRAGLFDLPTDHDEVQRRYTLAPEDIAFARQHRRQHNRLGFAVQLALVHDLGRLLRVDEHLPVAIIDVVAEQLGVEPGVFDLYARRDETRREHASEIVLHLKLRTIRQADYRVAITAGAAAAVGTERGEPIVRAIIDELKVRRIIVPPAPLVERFALAGRAFARRYAHRELIRGLDTGMRERLEALLTTRVEDDGRTVHGWISEAPEGPKLKNLVRVVDRLRCLRPIGLLDDHRKVIHANRYGIIAREAKIIHARELIRFSIERRLATLVAFVIERQAALTDLAIEMFDRMLGSAYRRAETSRKARLLGQAEALAQVARQHLILGRALVEARRNCSDLSQAVEGSLGWDRLASNLEAAAEALGADEGDGLEELIGRHALLRGAAAVLFDAFGLRSFKPHDPILTAVDMLRAIYRRERRKLPDRVPTAFLKRSWRKRVRAGTNGFNARAYEVAVLVHLRDRLRAGDIWVEGSRAYRTFDDYLLPRPTFTLMRAEGRLGLAVPDDFAAWRAERAALLDLKLNALSVAATKNQLPEAAITADGLTISPIRREEREQARALSSRLYNLMPRVRITDLLAEVNVWTAFANHFTHYRTGEPAATDEPALMGAILADATNLGLDRMAESSRGVTIHQLNLVIERHIRHETYAAGVAVIVDAQHAEPLSKVWGTGDTSSSDGQFFPAGGRGEAAADYNARHGSEPGTVFYDFISDRFASFYSKVIPAAASEAPHVLDGLLHNDSALEIQEHATDTAGAVESVFALFHLFGYRFAPRIRDFGDRKLFVIAKHADYGPLASMIGGAVDLGLVEENWDEVLRLAASIRAGTVPPSVILRKIAAFPRQNALSKALREIGRVERSIFMADWLMDLELRRRSHANLNKGESRHALARAVFFHRLGELRDRTAEAMAYRASGLNLVVNAIILWNTTYLARTLNYVRGQGVVLTDELLSHVAPVKWDHIALTGDYLWSEIERPRERFRPLRTNRFDAASFRFA
jgi:TnpA family transposase